MTAVRYRNLWIKVLVVLLLVVLGIAGIYYAYETEEAVPPMEEEPVEEEVTPDAERV